MRERVCSALTDELQDFAAKSAVADASLGVEYQAAVLADVVVREIGMVDEDHDHIGGLELRGVAGHAS